MPAPWASSRAKAPGARTAACALPVARAAIQRLDDKLESEPAAKMPRLLTFGAGERELAELRQVVDVQLAREAREWRRTSTWAKRSQHYGRPSLMNFTIAGMTWSGASSISQWPDPFTIVPVTLFATSRA